MPVQSDMPAAASASAARAGGVVRSQAAARRARGRERRRSWIETLGLAPGAPLPALVTTNAGTVALLLVGAATGHPLAPLGPKLTVPELTRLAGDLGSQVVLHEDAFTATAGELGRATGVRPVPVPEFGHEDELDKLSAPGPDSVVVYLYTGGTTGAPKRVPLTQQVLARRSEVLSGLARLDEPDAVYATGSPVHHIGGLGNLLVALAAGATVVATSSFSVDWWRGLKDLGVTYALLVPSMIEMLFAAGALDAVPLRTLVYGRIADSSRDPAAGAGGPAGRAHGEPVRADREQPGHLSHAGGSPACRERAPGPAAFGRSPGAGAGPARRGPGRDRGR